MIDDLAPFESPKILIDGAKESIRQFESTCNAFLTECHYGIVERQDSKTGEKVISLRFQQRIPRDLRLHAYRIVNELRHSLDQAVGDGAIRLGRPNSKGVYFPIGSSPSDLRNEAGNRCKNVHPDLIAFILGFKPHYGLGGDQELYSFLRLAGPNKHQRIVRISLGDLRKLFTPNFSAGGLYLVAPVSFGHYVWNDRRNELEFARIGIGGEMEIDLRISLQIVIDKGKPPLSGPAPTIFSRLASKIEGIVLGIEAETIRIARSLGI